MCYKNPVPHVTDQAEARLTQGTSVSTSALSKHCQEWHIQTVVVIVWLGTDNRFQSFSQELTRQWWRPEASLSPFLIPGERPWQPSEREIWQPPQGHAITQCNYTWSIAIRSPSRWRLRQMKRLPPPLQAPPAEAFAYPKHRGAMRRFISQEIHLPGWLFCSNGLNSFESDRSVFLPLICLPSPASPLQTLTVF